MQASKIQEAAYSCEWYSAPLNFQKLLLMFLIRCQHETIIDIRPFFVLNYSLLTKVSSAISYMTLNFECFIPRAVHQTDVHAADTVAEDLMGQWDTSLIAVCHSHHLWRQQRAIEVQKNVSMKITRLSNLVLRLAHSSIMVLHFTFESRK